MILFLLCWRIKTGDQCTPPSLPPAPLIVVVLSRDKARFHKTQKNVAGGGAICSSVLVAPATSITTTSSTSVATTSSTSVATTSTTAAAPVMERNVGFRNKGNALKGGQVIFKRQKPPMNRETTPPPPKHCQRLLITRHVYDV